MRTSLAKDQIYLTWEQAAELEFELTGLGEGAPIIETDDWQLALPAGMIVRLVPFTEVPSQSWLDRIRRFLRS